MAARKRIGEERFVDIGQPELNSDAIAVAERIYDFAGLELADEVRRAMEQFGAENRAGARGQHLYSAEEFGLSSGQIREAFADYIDAYQSYWTPRS